MNLCRNVRAETEELLGSKCHFSCFHVRDGRQDELPSSSSSSSSSSLWWETFGVGGGGGGGRYHLRSAHKAASVRTKQPQLLSPPRCAFISCVAGNCLSTRPIARGHLSGCHRSGFYWSGSCFVRTDGWLSSLSSTWRLQRTTTTTRLFTCCRNIWTNYRNTNLFMQHGGKKLP